MSRLLAEAGGSPSCGLGGAVPSTPKGDDPPSSPAPGDDRRRRREEKALPKGGSAFVSVVERSEAFLGSAVGPTGCFERDKENQSLSKRRRGRL